MKLFKCQSVQQMLYFENISCEKCHHLLGYLPEIGVLSAVDPDGMNWRALANPASRYRILRKLGTEYLQLRWLMQMMGIYTVVPAATTRTIPRRCLLLSIIRNWQKIEEAKRRLVVFTDKDATASADHRQAATRSHLCLDFLADLRSGPKVMDSAMTMV